MIDNYHVFAIIIRAKTTKMNKNQTHILGCKLDLRSRKQVGKDIFRFIRSNRFNHIVTLNPEICLKGEVDEKYRKILNKTELSIRDAFGLSIGAFLLGAGYAPRISGRQLLGNVMRLSVKERAKVYLIGGKGDTASKAANHLQQIYPHLQIVGAEEGIAPGKFSLDTPDLVGRINDSGAKVLLVAFGAPKQEEWIATNRDQLHSVRIAIGIGGLFDYLAGNVASPPNWITKLGMEWLFRLTTQPHRWRRIVDAVIIFPWKCVIWRFRMWLSYRKNVVGVIHNDENEILLVSPHWSQTLKWQFPQGGVDDQEYPSEAILREMSEELGTEKFSIEQNHPGVYRYVWPKWYRLLRGYKGQKQDLFILSFKGDDSEIDIEQEGELRDWKWVQTNQVVNQLAPARKSIGEIALKYID